MATLKFGISLGLYPFGVPEPDFLFRFAERAEELGFDSISLGDHIVMHSPLLEPLTVLSAFAARTKRIALTTGVLLLPLRNPAVVAKMVSSLDYLSGGRVICGVGVGGENPKEFELCGIPLQERGRRTDEAIVILRKLWAGSHVSHSGHFWQFEDASMDPKPVQRPGPPIWVGGRSDAALRRAALLCDGWVAYLVAPERYAASLEKIRGFAAAAGRDLSAFTPAHHQFIYVAPNRELARDKAIAYLSKNYNQPFEGIVERYCALGSPADCVRWLERCAESGVQHVILRSTCGPEDLLEQMAIYANEILPCFRG